MSGKCTQEHCSAPDTPCNMGESELKNCQHWQETSEQTEKSTVVDGSGQLPWSSNALGIIDLQFLAARSKPKVIGVIGSRNAGKTTLLVTLYLLLSRGYSLKDRRFAGSYTLGGWENLAHWLRWQPEGLGPGFPPHTASSHNNRIPGLLHLGFRYQNELLEDVLFTDAPGEWFDRWAINKDDPNAEGARWIMRYADVLMLFIDSEELAGSNRGQARSLITTLARRLGDQSAGRPVIIVWAKSDITISKPIFSTLEETFEKCFSKPKTFEITVKPTEGWNESHYTVFINLLHSLLTTPNRVKANIEPLPVYQPKDLFLAFRGQ